MDTKNCLATKTKRIPSAFTLVELIVVITILAILATVGFLALSGYTQDAKDASVKTNLRSVMTAISSESAVTNNSPRYYIVHETGAALSDGTVAFIDGRQLALTGGIWNAAGTNYSAGNPDWTKLKINPEKFRLSSLGSRLAAAFGTAEAAYDPKAMSVGAVDATLTSTANGHNRTASFFQVTAVLPETKNAVVFGNYPASAGGVSGLVKDSAYWSPLVNDQLPTPTFSVSGTFWVGWAWAQITLCWTRATADALWNFVASYVLPGTSCNNVIVDMPNYYCSVSVNGPASLNSNVTGVAWSCKQVSNEYGPVNFTEAQAQCAALWSGWRIPNVAEMVNPWNAADVSVLYKSSPSLFGSGKMYWLAGKNWEGGRTHGQLLSVPGWWNHYENCEDNANTCTYFNWTTTSAQGYYWSVWTLYVRCVK